MTKRVGGIVQGGGQGEREKEGRIWGGGRNREREGDIVNNFKFYRLQKEYLF